MATQVQLRRGTTAENNAFTGADGELTVDTTLYTLRVHDGATAGGHVVTGSAPQLLAIPLYQPGAADWSWTNMPAAATFLFGSHRHVVRVDLSIYTQCRLIVNTQGTPGSAGAKLILKYKATSFSAVVGDYSDIGTSEVSAAITSPNAVTESAWIDLAAGAIADVYLAIVGSGGDGATDPTIGAVVAQFQ